MKRERVKRERVKECKTYIQYYHGNMDPEHIDNGEASAISGYSKEHLRHLARKGGHNHHTIQ